MAETINYVQEDIIEDERTAGMFGCVNANYQRAAEADLAEFRRRQTRIKEIEAEEDAKRKRFWTLVHTVVGAAVILAGVYFLNGIGAMHDALAEAFALITAFGAGKIIGECRE